MDLGFGLVSGYVSVRASADDGMRTIFCVLRVEYVGWGSG